MEITIRSDVFGLSSTKHLRRNAVLNPDNDMEACRKPPRDVPYKCTYVPYDGTFGASNQGQMLDVWQNEDSQIHHLIQ